MHALRRKQAGYRSVWDRLGNDLFIIGEVAFDRCTPRKLYAHAPWWTLIVVAVSLIAFEAVCLAHGDLEASNSAKLTASSYMVIIISIYI